MKTVSGIFDSSLTADAAVGALLNEGFSRDDISLLMSEQTRHHLFSSTDDEAGRVAKDGLAGAAIGGALGALLAGLTGAGAIVLSGGTLLVAGPIVAILSGAGVGATVGGLSGALIGAGFAADDAQRFEKEIKQGKAVVIVHAGDAARAAKAERALHDAGASTRAA